MRSMLLAGVVVLGVFGSASVASAGIAPPVPNVGPAHHGCAVRLHAERRTPTCLLELAAQVARGLGDPHPTRRSWTSTTAGRSGYVAPGAKEEFRRQRLLGVRLDGDFVQQSARDGEVRSREVRLLVDPATRWIVSWQFVGASYEGRLPPLGSLGDGSHRF